MSGGLQRFLGDTLLRTVVKLTVLSFVVGVVLTALNLSVFDLYDRFLDTLRWLWNRGFQLLGDFGHYLLVGAAVVVPVFLLLRLARFRR